MPRFTGATRLLRPDERQDALARLKAVLVAARREHVGSGREKLLDARSRRRRLLRRSPGFAGRVDLLGALLYELPVLSAHVEDDLDRHQLVHDLQPQESGCRMLRTVGIARRRHVMPFRVRVKLCE